MQNILLKFLEEHPQIKHVQLEWYDLFRFYGDVAGQEDASIDAHVYAEDLSIETDDPAELREWAAQVDWYESYFEDPDSGENYITPDGAGLKIVYLRAEHEDFTDVDITLYPGQGEEEPYEEDEEPFQNMEELKAEAVKYLENTDHRYIFLPPTIRKGWYTVFRDSNTGEEYGTLFIDAYYSSVEEERAEEIDEMTVYFAEKRGISPADIETELEYRE